MQKNKHFSENICTDDLLFEDLGKFCLFFIKNNNHYFASEFCTSIFKGFLHVLVSYYF